MFTLPPQTKTPLEDLGFSIPSKEYLVKQYVGRKLNEVRTPRIIVDRAVVKRNCERLGAIADKSGKKIRVHIKTHKVNNFVNDKTVDSLINFAHFALCKRLLKLPKFNWTTQKLMQLWSLHWLRRILLPVLT